MRTCPSVFVSVGKIHGSMYARVMPTLKAMGLSARLVSKADVLTEAMWSSTCRAKCGGFKIICQDTIFPPGVRRLEFRCSLPGAPRRRHDIFYLDEANQVTERVAHAF